MVLLPINPPIYNYNPFLQREMKKCAKTGGLLKFRGFWACILYVLCFVNWCAHILTNQLNEWGRYRVRVIETSSIGSSV